MSGRVAWWGPSCAPRTQEEPALVLNGGFVLRFPAKNSKTGHSTTASRGRRPVGREQRRQAPGGVAVGGAHATGWGSSL